MRIIGGQARGRKLAGPGGHSKNSPIRPTADRAREALFNILGSNCLRGASVLDLFAGTGAFGLEAASRGAARVCLIDSLPLALTRIQQNRKICKLEEETIVLKRDLKKGLFFFETLCQNDPCLPHAFDFIFIDPPYDSNLWHFLLCEVQENRLLKSKGQVICEDRACQKLPDKVHDLSCFDTRKYGDSCFWFYK